MIFMNLNTFLKLVEAIIKIIPVPYTIGDDSYHFKVYTYSFKINASAKCLIFSIAETQANWSFLL